MYWTPLKNYLWNKSIKSALQNKSLFFTKTAYVNDQLHPCLVVKLRKMQNYQFLNRITAVQNELIICYFQNLNENLNLKFTFSILEVNWKNHISQIYNDLLSFQKNQIQEKHSYWLIPTQIFKHWKLTVGDYFFIT